MEKTKGKVYTSRQRQIRQNLKVVIVILFVFFVLTRIFPIPLWLILLLLPIFALGIWLTMKPTIANLIITDEGITYQLENNAVFANWDSLSYFRIVHHQAGTTIYIMPDDSDGIPISDTNNVPFHFDNEYGRWMVKVKEFLKTDLGRDLLYHAPHLFKNEEQLPEKEKDAKGWLTRN
jgi:hypothetical protein